MNYISFIPVKFLFKKLKNNLNNPKKSIKNALTENPEIFELIGQRFAFAQFKRAYRSVFAYRRFINEANIGEISTFEDFLKKVPEIDKKSYIQKNSLRDLCYYNSLNNATLIYRSSGFSGKPAFWCRSNEELELNKKQTTIGLRFNFLTHKYKTLIINCFDLSSWITGINVAKIADEETAIINVGMKQEETVEIIQDIGENFDQILLLGYPPFIKWFFDSNSKINWKKYKIHLLLGGEGFAISFREYMYKKYIFQGKIISAYGSSDLGIPCANETDASIEIIKSAEKNPYLKKDLFSKEQLPMLFQYNPTSYHIYSNNIGELIFTILNLDAIQPLVKYNIHDSGGVVSYNKMCEILQKNKINIEIPLKFPFLYVYGRSTGEIKVCGTLIYPENIKEAIYKNNEIADKTTGIFKMYLKEKMTKYLFCIDMELNKGVISSKELQNKFANLLEKTLSQINYEYGETRKLSPIETKIHLRLFNYGHFPHKSGIKIKYI